MESNNINNNTTSTSNNTSINNNNNTTATMADTNNNSEKGAKKEVKLERIDVRELFPGKRDAFAFVVDNLFTKEECDELIRKTEERGYEEAMVGRDQVRVNEQRNNWRCIFFIPSFFLYFTLFVFFMFLNLFCPFCIFFMFFSSFFHCSFLSFSINDVILMKKRYNR